MSRFTFELAKKLDDSALQQILQDNPMDGEIQLTFQRNPSYFGATKVEGNFTQVVIGREKKNGKIIGFGTRSIKSLYINGKVCDVGYLNNLRLNKEYRGGTLIARGYKYFKQLHKDGKTLIYFTTIGEENEYTKNVLTKGRTILPIYHDFGLYHSIAVLLGRKKRQVKSKVRVIKNSGKYTKDIIECIHRNGPLKQFYPYYTIENIISNNGLLRGLRQEDFYIALKDNQVIGVLAKWDQRDFKQNIVVKYKGKMRLIKPIYNLGSKFFGYPLMPDTDSELNLFYVSLIAIDSNDLQIFQALLRELYNDYAGKNYAYFVVGLHSRDPLLKVLKEYRHFEYKTRVYIVYWEDGETFYKKLDNRVPYLEIGTL